jgi:hypothetical protein
MIVLTHSPKPRGSWSEHELKWFSVQVVSEDSIESFFGLPSLPMTPDISRAVLENLNMPHEGLKLPRAEDKFFGYLQDATIPDYGRAPRVQRVLPMCSIRAISGSASTSVPHMGNDTLMDDRNTHNLPAS